MWLQDIWVSRDGMSQAHWGLTDYVWPDDRLPRLLLAALSARYRSLCFIMAWEEPDTFEAGSALIWQGRVRKRGRLLDVDRIRKMIYLRHGLSPDGDNDDESTANDDLDIALLDYVQREWDRELERLLRGLSKRA